MNEIRPTVGFEFANEYDEARKKFFDFVDALNKLTPVQKQQLANECLHATGNAILFQQFIDFMNGRR